MAMDGPPAGHDRNAFSAPSDLPPRYLELRRSGGLAGRIETARAWLTACHACPHGCGADRAAGELGVCRTGRHAIVDAAFPHRGEEPCLSGWRGSGTIFFGNCNLACVFCQNWEISQMGGGREVEAEELASLMLRLQLQECHNINLVTPEHVVPQVVEALGLAIDAGLRLPIVYNTGAYDALDSLRLLDGLIDIYMPDFKFWTAATAERLCGAADYPERAREAIAEMHRQVGPLRLDASGIARRGVLVRHLVVPGLAEETAAILRWLADEVSPDTCVNIMGQYRPAYRVGAMAGAQGGEPADPAGAAGAGAGAAPFADIDRRPSTREMAAAHAAARAAGLWRFAQ